MTKLEFGGPEWTQALRLAMLHALDNAGDDGKTAVFSMSEQYLGAPAHLVGSEGQLGWHVRFIEGQFDFVFEPSREVDVFISADYDGVLPLARLEYGDDAERLADRERIVGELIGSGRMSVEGDLTTRPPFLEGIHDAMARVTA
jgi:hypothetical protein